MSENILNVSGRLERQRLDYSDCVQFLFMHIACLAAFWTGVSLTAIGVCLALYVVRMFAITAGFHRLLAHRTYKSGSIFRFLIAFTGTASYQKGPLWWSAHHRGHHLHTDTEEDLHSPLAHSFWCSHVEWFLRRNSQSYDKKLISNLIKHRDLRLLDKWYAVPPIMLAVGTFLSGFALRLYAPGLGTNEWQMLIWGFFISTVLLYHGTFTVNSLAHVFGKRRFATDDNSRNNWFVALITLGEGWHNNHHYYPTSERQGFYWWEIDVSHYTLRVLEYLGIVWDLRAPPSEIPERAFETAANGLTARRSD
jgi:stearoyl-CoA desaturase (Delta-9 desaturase)